MIENTMFLMFGILIGIAISFIICTYFLEEYKQLRSSYDRSKRSIESDR